MLRFLALASLLIGASASAQTTFAVTTVTKTAANPYFNQGHPMGYTMNGVEGAEITVRRGETVTFQLAGVQSFHPFYLSTSPSGNGAGEYTDGVTGAPATGNQTVTFVVPMDAPDLLWYQCTFHEFMGYRITVINATANEPEPGTEALRLTSANPTSGDVQFSVTLAETAETRIQVVTADGRLVATLLDGVLAGTQAFTFETARLAAGVYILQVTSGAFTERRPVTVVR